MHSVDNFNLNFTAHGVGKHVYFQVLTYTGKKTIIRCNPDTMVAKVVDALPEGLPPIQAKKVDIPSTSQPQPVQKKGCGCSKKKTQQVAKTVEKSTSNKSEEKHIISQQKEQDTWKSAILGAGSVGFGDTVKHWIETVSFGLIKQKPGCGCERRQHKLNKWFPYTSDA